MVCCDVGFWKRIGYGYLLVSINWIVVVEEEKSSVSRVFVANVSNV